MREYKYHPKALVESNSAADEYLGIDSELAKDFYRKLDNAIFLICENPECVRPRKDHRRFNLKRFPFYLPFIIRENTIFLLAVAHNSRKPGYWKDRLLDQ